jgi:hypothetical protein
MKEKKISDEKADSFDNLKKIESFIKSFSNKNSIEITIEEFRVIIKTMQQIKYFLTDSAASKQTSIEMYADTTNKMR